MERIARTVGLSSVEIRRINFLKQGETTITEQTIHEPIDLPSMLDRALNEHSSYQLKRRVFRVRTSPATPKKGIGIATFLHGAGFTGSGERYLSSVVGVEGTPDGRVRVLVSSTEFGQGTNTVLCQIASEALRLPYEDIEIAQPDTSDVPNSGPTVASRTAMVVGKLVASAARGLEQTLTASGMLEANYTPEQFRAACRQYVAAHGQVSVVCALRTAGQYFLGRSELPR